MKQDLSMIGLGLYSLSEVAALTNIPAPRIRRWLTGHRIGEKSYPALWRSQLEQYYRLKRHLVSELTNYVSGVDDWLVANRGDYRKRQLRKLVVEPFLKLMAEYDIATSRRERPRKRIFDALFDWLGVEQKFRPSNAGINAIAAELVGAGPSKSNANRRSKK